LLIIFISQAGGINSNGQGVGAFLLTDSSFVGLSTGISTSLVAENSTSFLLQNTHFTNTPKAIDDWAKGAVLLAGQASGTVSVDSWGFGRIVSPGSPISKFQSGGAVPAPTRNGQLFKDGEKIFTRGAPTYRDVPASEMVNVKAYGAKGDGVSDDTVVLNQVLQKAANHSAVVFFPFGIYKVSDTLKIPLNSRIVGQAWSQILGSGSKFQDPSQPRAVVQVGLPGELGIVEISDMLVTVAGPTAGAVLIEWNIHQQTQGSAALWSEYMLNQSVPG
jgi:hypothetical protein